MRRFAIFTLNVWRSAVKITPIGSSFETIVAVFSRFEKGKNKTNEKNDKIKDFRKAVCLYRTSQETGV